VTDRGMKHLTVLKNLRNLDLKDCLGLSDETLRELQPLKSLRSLSLPSQNLSLKAAKQFQQANPDRRLWARMSDFPEIDALWKRSTQHALYPSISPTAYFGEGFLTFETHDDVGLGYSVLSDLPKLAGLKLSGSAINDDVAQQLGQLTELTALDIGHSNITDAGLAAIGRLTGLESLDLERCDVTDKGLQHLKELRQLGTLNLSYTKVTDDGVEFIASRNPLSFLGVSGLPISDRSLPFVAKMSANTHYGGVLDVSGSQVTAKGLASLQTAPFAIVKLNHLPITDADVKTLRTWPNVYELDLSGTHVTGEELNFQSNTKLAILRLEGTRVTDATLPHLQLPDSIHTLSLSHTTVTGRTLPELSRFPIKALQLAGTPLSQQGLANVFALKITNLDLTDVSLTEPLSRSLFADTEIWSLTVHADSALMRTIPETRLATTLEFLTLSRATEKHLDILMQIPGLRNLSLVDSTFGRESFERLQDHPALSQLVLQRCQLTSEATPEIGRIGGLKRLVFESTELQAADLDDINRSNPNLSISVDRVLTPGQPDFQSM